jgi:uncharacterized protein with PQ loop repeat
MITQFALRLICGMSVVWCVMPRSRVTSGFFRIQMLVTLGLSVLSAIAANQIPESAEAKSISPTVVGWISAVLGVLSFVGSVLWTLERRHGGTVVVFAIAILSSTTIVLANSSGGELQSLNGTLYWMSELATAFVSGAAVSGMLLGHWYLTAPSMSTEPLNKVNAWLGIAALIRLSFAVVALIVIWSNLQDRINGVAGRAWTMTHTVWFSMQWTGGMLGPLAVSIAVVRILKYKNTQAATGVLFVGVILAFLGEMTGALLRHELSLPL